MLYPEGYSVSHISPIWVSLFSSSVVLSLAIWPTCNSLKDILLYYLCVCFHIGSVIQKKRHLDQCCLFLGGIEFSYFPIQCKPVAFSVT